MDISSLKVTELKAELSKRGLPTKGLKKELSERLKSALDAEVAKEATATESDTGKRKREQEDESTKTQELPDVVLPPSKKQRPSSASDGTSDTLSIRGKATEVSIQSATQEDSNVHVDMDVSVGNPQEDVVIKGASAEATPSTDVAIEEGIDHSKRNIKGTSNGTIVSIRGSATKKEEPSTSINVSEIDGAMVASQDKTAKDLLESQQGPVSIRGKASNQELSENQTSPQPVIEKASSPINATSNEETSNSIALYISGLVRPFTLPQLKSLLSSFGPYKEFWIDSVKSHCYIIYESTSSACDAHKGLTPPTLTRWPPSTGQPLSAVFIPVDQVSLLIAEEESQPTVRLRLQVEGEGDKKVYNLVRFDGLKFVSSAPPPLPQPARPLSSTKRLVTEIGIRGAARRRDGEDLQNDSNESRYHDKIQDPKLPDNPIGGPDRWFSKTKTEPSLYWKEVSKDDAEKRLRGLEKNLERLNDRDRRRRDGKKADRWRARRDS